MRVEFLVPRLTGAFTPGQSLFIYSMPDTVSSGLLILPSLTGGRIDPQYPRWRNQDALQVVGRDPDVVKARAMAKTASDLLTIDGLELITAASAGITDMGDINVVFCRPTTDPLVFPRPLSDIWEASVNFSVCWYGAS